MSFETAKPVTPESFSQEFQFTRRPQVRYPVKSESKQSVNISKETKSRAAMRRMQNPYAPKLSYGTNGEISRGIAIGQFFSAVA